MRPPVRTGICKRCHGRCRPDYTLCYSCHCAIDPGFKKRVDAKRERDEMWTRRAGDKVTVPTAAIPKKQIRNPVRDRTDLPAQSGVADNPVHSSRHLRRPLRVDGHGNVIGFADEDPIRQ